MPFNTCSTCQGYGISVDYLAEWAAPEEVTFDDLGADFQRAYLNGLLTKRCRVCQGERVVWETTHLYIEVTHEEAVILAKGLLGQMAHNASYPRQKQVVCISVDEQPGGTFRVTAG